MPTATPTGIVLLENLNLRNGQRKSMLELEEAICEPPEFTLTTEGACTLTLTVADADRKLTRSPLITEKSWSEVAGVRFEQVAISKVGDRVTLTYEDGITAALRRRNAKLSIPANSMTRAGIGEKLAHEARVPILVDPAKRRKVAAATRRSVGKDKSNSWDLLGDLASAVNWRRFSTGRTLVFGSDEWLMDRVEPVTLRENTGSVGNIDFDLDTGKRASTAKLDVDATLYALQPGQPIVLTDDMGPASGKWLVSTFSRKLTSTRATVELVREKHSLKEPKPAPKGEGGEPDFLPGQGGGSDSGGVAATAARERMVNFALAQNGKPYVWGASGPGSYDCSGLVQAATAYAGHMCPKPSANQAAAVAAAGKSLSIETAIRTRGALLFRIGVAEYNHVVISLGNGQTIEAMGSAYGVCIGGTAGRGWTSAGWWV